MNEIKLSGVVVRDPELIYSPSGQARLSFYLEIEEPKVSQYDITAKNWKYKILVVEERAEKLVETLRGGNEIEITGQIYTWSWKPPKSEQWIQKTEILAGQVKVLKSTQSQKHLAEIQDLPF